MHIWAYVFIELNCVCNSHQYITEFSFLWLPEFKILVRGEKLGALFPTNKILCGSKKPLFTSTISILEWKHNYSPLLTPFSEI